MTEKTVQVGERLAVSYDITNRGQSDGEQTVELWLDGEVVDSEALVLDTGSTGRMSLVTDAFADEDDGQLYEVEIATADRVAQVMTVEVTALPDSEALQHHWETFDDDTDTVIDIEGDADISVSSDADITDDYVTFDGEDDNGVSEAVSSSESQTVGTWVRVESDNDGIPIAHGSAFSSDDLNWVLDGRDAGGDLLVQNYSWSDGVDNTNNYNDADSQWAFVSWTIDYSDGYDTRLYINGEFVEDSWDDQSETSYGGDRSEPIYFGSDPDDSQHHNISVGETLYWHSGLSDEEHEQAYEVTKSRYA